ncbi:nucleotidyltransferase substrate binding protein [Terracidiphilus sp.]|jgi:nucleotidyltransferase substrate binding protein (TIGR01987 family)|uniref:nucleotidyltransferase substrate binding protein n=1 Tax=Terracidiphilus sp. TaxID=1964191 RepID=UPI003C19A4B7
MATLDFSPLGKAVERLREGLDALKREPENTLYRDAVIQRFEFTYGLCAAMLKRYLEHAAEAQVEREMSFPTLIRTASEYGLLRSGWDTWFKFREARNLTSHTYNEETARQVLERIPEFMEEAEFLYMELERTCGDGSGS